MSTYVGITVGPIFDTISYTSTPAAMWFSSTFFSDVTRRLCQKICAAFPDAEIHSPYYDKTLDFSDGVGKYHDRILFCASNVSSESLDALIDEVKAEMTEDFPKELRTEDTTRFLKQYLQIHYVVIDPENSQAENIIFALSPYLDAMELVKSFPSSNDHNPFLRMFSAEDTNSYIKSSPLFQGVTDNQFVQPGGKSIRTIESIASCNDHLARNRQVRNYFAVVSADGDSMSDFLKTLDSDQKVTEFSRCCLRYAQKAAKEIGAFGGMTIYAGGDDLVFLAPVVNTKEKTVFDLCNEISDIFKKELEAGRDLPTAGLPTVSFGIAICYKKFPLYEAFASSCAMLATIKNTEGDQPIKKNGIACYVQKHSGQSVGLLIRNDAVSVLKNMLEEAKETEIQSILYTLGDFFDCFCLLAKQVKTGQIDNADKFYAAWKNFFDNDDQRGADEHIRALSDECYQHFAKPANEQIAAIPGMETQCSVQPDRDNEITAAQARINALISCLRLKKFIWEEHKEDGRSTE